MRYYVFSPQYPRQLRIFDSQHALNDALASDYTQGQDFAGSDVVIDADGRKGRVTFDGTAYELAMSDERITPQELRSILTAHLAALGRKPTQTAGPIANVTDVTGFAAVLAQFPQGRRLVTWLIAGAVLIGVVVLLGGATLIVVRVVRGPPLPVAAAQAQGKGPARGGR